MAHPAIDFPASMATRSQNKVCWTCVAGVLLIALVHDGCRNATPGSDFLVVLADHRVTGNSQYPAAVDPIRVGTYSAETKSGAGYFYDDVLEYRVWLNPKKVERL